MPDLFFIELVLILYQRGYVLEFGEDLQVLFLSHGLGLLPLAAFFLLIFFLA